MERRMKRLLTCALLLAAAPLNARAQATYEAAPHGTRVLERGPLSIKVLVEAANLGGAEVEVGEITFPAGGSPARGHKHGAVEIFYVLEGELGHVVNGEEHRLTRGMVGIVRPGDEVIHRVLSAEPVKALVIWAPGGEVARIAPGFEQKPVGPFR
jgi:quercetin dioxygenase-like cupin family protein